MSTAIGRPVGTITIVEDHQSRPYEIRIDDQYPFGGQSVAVRSVSIAGAAELLAAVVEFEMARLSVLGLAVPMTPATVCWRKLAARYLAELRAAAGDLGEARIEINGLILDPNGTWSPARPNRVAFVGAAA